MPELPEVETMVRGLRPALEGRRLRRLEVLDASLVHGCSADELARFGGGATVVEVGAAREVGRRDPGRTSGNYRHPAEDDGRLLAARARSTGPHPPGIPRG